jgi:hypothetical protein
MNDPNLIDDLKEALKKEGVEDPDSLVVVQIANDSLIGEAVSMQDHDADQAMLDLSPLYLRAPKRFVRIQRMDPNGGLNVEYAIIDFDVMQSGGQVRVRPLSAYWFAEAGAEGQTILLKMMLGYFDNSRKRRAAAAGIHLDLDTTKFPAKPR